MSENQSSLIGAHDCDDSIVKADGSVPMSGGIEFINSTPRNLLRALTANVTSYQGITGSGHLLWSMVNGSDSTNYLKDGRAFSLRKLTSELAKALQLLTFDASGNQTEYNIFGEHNTDLLATQIQSLIDSGVIEVGGFRSPIKVANSDNITKNAPFTGTGKGKLFLYSSNTSNITIDGKSLGSQNGGAPDVEYEFTESFKVSAESSTSGAIKAVAVFY